MVSSLSLSVLQEMVHTKSAFILLNVPATQPASSGQEGVTRVRGLRVEVSNSFHED